jgi:hypothetical protein
MISGYFPIKKINFNYNKFIYIISQIYFYHNIWGLGIGDWGLGIGDWAQSP